MIFLAAVLSMASGVFAAAVVCRAIRLTIAQDVVVGALSFAAMYLANKLAGDVEWPFVFLFVGYGLAVITARTNQQPRHATTAWKPSQR
jgi:uncharacterized membrane protein YedE/YeeE